jgi:hypothetical protein
MEYNYPEGCAAVGELHTRRECRPDSRGQADWFRVTYQEYECQSPPPLRRITISAEDTDEKCTNDDYAFWAAAVKQEYGEVWVIEPSGYNQYPPEPPPTGDDIFPPEGKLKPVYGAHSPGECIDFIIWEDEAGHQYSAQYDKNGVGKWTTGGPTSPPPPIPHRIGGTEIPDCPPPQHASTGGAFHFTFGGFGGGDHNDHHGGHDDHDSRPPKVDTSPVPHD